MSNKIRYHLKEQVEQIIPKLHLCYRVVGKYQKNRNERNAEVVLEELSKMSGELQIFKPHVQLAKQPYFDAVGDSLLSISDRIIALDIAVGAMHIAFSVSRSYSHRESQELRDAIASARYDDFDNQFTTDVEGRCINGIPASGGVFTGKVKIVSRASEYKRLPNDSVVVTKMTRPEFVLGVESIAAIVTDQGGNLCHAAIAARELHIPCVVGTRNATEKISNGQIVTVNGDKGTVEILKRR